MKRALLILTAFLVIVSCILVIAPRVPAQHVYLGMYWIAGTVSDPDNQGTAGRKVVFYKFENDPPAAFSYDYVETGLSGRSNAYILNAFQDYRIIPLTAGRYWVAIVQDENGYGAGPTEIDVTGSGYNIANLVLTHGAGIPDPGEHVHPLAPVIENVYFGNRKYQWELAETKGEEFEFVVSPQPRISALITSNAGLDTNSIAMVVREGSGESMGEESIGLSDMSKVTMAGPSAAPTSVNFSIDYFDQNKTLPEGHSIPITFRASNAYGTTTRIARVDVFGGEATVRGQILTFPSPLRLSSQGELTIQYVLTKDVNTDIYLIDVSGRVVKKFVNYARQEGGSAGLNKVTWDLMTDQGQRVSAGILVISLVNRENGKLLGKGKATFLP